jgi:hypothetical protein
MPASTRERAVSPLRAVLSRVLLALATLVPQELREDIDGKSRDYLMSIAGKVLTARLRGPRGEEAAPRSMRHSREGESGGE